VQLEENINRGKKMAKNKFNPADSVNPETIALHGGDYMQLTYLELKILVIFIQE
jgi:hypothetical protein